MPRYRAHSASLFGGILWICLVWSLVCVAPVLAVNDADLVSCRAMVTSFVTGICLGSFSFRDSHRPTSKCNPNTTHVLRLFLMFKPHVLSRFAFFVLVSLYICPRRIFHSYHIWRYCASCVRKLYISSLTFLLVLLTPRCPAHVQLWCIYGRCLRGGLKM